MLQVFKVMCIESFSKDSCDFVGSWNYYSVDDSVIYSPDDKKFLKVSPEFFKKYFSIVSTDCEVADLEQAKAIIELTQDLVPSMLPESLTDLVQTMKDDFDYRSVIAYFKERGFSLCELSSELTDLFHPYQEIEEHSKVVVESTDSSLGLIVASTFSECCPLDSVVSFLIYYKNLSELVAVVNEKGLVTLSNKIKTFQSLGLDCSSVLSALNLKEGDVK